MVPPDNAIAYLIQPVDGFVAGTSGCFVTGVNLPQGATMTGLTTFWSSIGDNASFFIYKHALSNGAVSVVSGGGVVDDTGARKSFKAIIQPSHVLVNNNQYSYSFVACLYTSQDNKFYGGKITYTYNNAGD